MLFFSIETIISQIVNDNDAPSRRNKSRLISQNNYCMMADINKQLEGKAFFYISDITANNAQIGAICTDYVLFDKYHDAFLQATGLDIKAISCNETTLKKCISMLNTACHNSFIADDDEVLAAFSLDDIYVRGFRNALNERVFTLPVNKEDAVLALQSHFFDSTILPELDRIYSRPQKKFRGHPVQYVLSTNDDSYRENAIEIILSALFCNGRLTSKRYCDISLFLDAENMYSMTENVYRTSYGGAVILRLSETINHDNSIATGDIDVLINVADMVKQYKNSVLTIICLPAESERLKATLYEFFDNINFIEINEERADINQSIAYFKSLAKKACIKIDKCLTSSLNEKKSYNATELHAIFDEWYCKKLKTSVFPQYSGVLSTTTLAKTSKVKSNAYAELSKLVGLSKAKATIDSILDFAKVQKLMANTEIGRSRPALSMLFTGNPGTCKTSTARLFANILREEDVISVGKLFEVGRADLCQKYVGWTAKAVKNLFEKAHGSVIFFDEIYSLVDKNGGSFGEEAVNTIVQEMENNRDVVCIFAGYPDKMQEFIASNPGLRSRISFNVEFDDYTVDELCGITDLIANKKGLTVTDGAMSKLRDIYAVAIKDPEFGNGRYVRNILEQASMRMATRLVHQADDKLMSTEIGKIIADDITTLPLVRNSDGKTKMGFIA